MHRPPLDIDTTKVTLRLPSGYAHIGVFDVKNRKAFAARPPAAGSAIAINHADLFIKAGGGPLVVKDRFMCFWFYPPGTCNGLIQGYPIDVGECNLLVRLDPNWSFQRMTLLPSHATAAIEVNINTQVGVGAALLRGYRRHGLAQPLSVHLIGPRATDSLFYTHRWEPPY